MSNDVEINDIFFKPPLVDAFHVAIPTGVCV